MSHPFDELWDSVDNELPGNWRFDGINRGLLCWVATAANYQNSTAVMSEQRVSYSAESPIEAIRGLIRGVGVLNG